jgi:hypothetical protein
MRSLSRWILPLGLATASVLGAATDALAQTEVRDRRPAPPADGPPREAPPAPRTERQMAPRRGYVWVPGAWDWRAGKWLWMSGHFERERHGQRWRERRWEQQNGAWVRVGGDWEDAPQYPVAAPPEPRDERPPPRRGQIWVKGHWDWSNGQWQWTAGHYERERAGSRWNDGRWEQRDGRWQYAEGRWGDGAGGSAWKFDSRGWTMLGEKTVDGRVDSDQVDFSQKQGKVSKLSIVVLDSDLEMIDLRVVFVSGNDLHPTDQHYFREDSRTRVINLPAGEILRAVQFKYRNLPGGGRARVQVWGNVR